MYTQGEQLSIKLLSIKFQLSLSIKLQLLLEPAGIGPLGVGAGRLGQWVI